MRDVITIFRKEGRLCVLTKNVISKANWWINGYVEVNAKESEQCKDFSDKTFNGVLFEYSGIIFVGYDTMSNPTHEEKQALEELNSFYEIVKEFLQESSQK